jgi:hypothetical protein
VTTPSGTDGAARTGVGPRPISFAADVRLSKEETFAACQILADADRCLIRSGRVGEAGALGDLFELLESRLVSDGAVPSGSVSDRAVPSGSVSDRSVPSGSVSDRSVPSPGVPQSAVGSNSMDSEFTQ